MRDEVENELRSLKKECFLYIMMAEQAPCRMTSKSAHCSIVLTERSMLEYDVESLASTAGRHIDEDDVKKASLFKPCGYAAVCLEAEERLLRFGQLTLSRNSITAIRC
jgi:hypothetical protein